MKTIAFLLLFVPGLSYAGSSCSQSELNGIRFVDSELKPVPLDFCNNPSGPQAHVVRAMKLLRSISLGSERSGPGDQGLISPSPFKYFLKNVKDILLLNCRIPAQRNDENSIIVCPSFTQWNALTQAEILVHEARHAEGGIRREHAECGAQAIRFEERLACDERYEDKGSYAASAEFYLKISRAPLGGMITPELRALASRRALYYLNCRMNQPYTKLNSGASVSCDELPD